MSSTAHLAILASFPAHYFLENIAARADGSFLVTVANRAELWFIPAAEEGASVEPRLIARPSQALTGIVETRSEVFHICTSRNLSKADCAHLLELDLRDWRAGEAVELRDVLAFPWSVQELNGSCQVAPDVLLVSDCFTSTVWRVDLACEGGPSARVWLQHPSMDHDPQGPTPDMPGVNGLRFAAQSGHLYYTSTAQRLFMRVRVDPDSHEADGAPEYVAKGVMADDFCVDETSGVAYLTTHRGNSIVAVSLSPGANGGERRVIAGEPFDERLVGPSSAVWSRGPQAYGRVAYVTSDGGTKSPPDGVFRPAKVLRLEL